MKARVKGTNNIIDVEFDKDAFNEGYPPYREKEYNMFYQPEQLEWVDNEENAEPDYWTRLEHQYAGMAMQGLMSKEYLDNPDSLVSHAIHYTHALVEKLKEKEEK